MDKETLLSLAEACITRAEEHQDHRDRADSYEVAALNLSLRGQIMSDFARVLRRTAAALPPPKLPIPSGFTGPG